MTTGKKIKIVGKPLRQAKGKLKSFDEYAKSVEGHFDQG